MLSEIELIQKKAKPVQSRKDYADLISLLSKKRVVMLGESTHGTHEFYEIRKQITLDLIEKEGFDFIAVEGDWPSFQNVNRSIGGNISNAAFDFDVKSVMSNFSRWPTWMWANHEVGSLLSELKKINMIRATDDDALIYGLDVYSLFDSIDCVLEQLEKISPVHAERARERYACFLPFQRNEKAYAKSLLQLPKGCEDQVIDVLADILKLKMDHQWVHHKALFDAEQNARIVRNSEAYYRAMIHADEASWNVRDEHMLETLNTLLTRHGPDAKAVVWAHNTHIGDYRATDMVLEGLVNLGGLAKEEFGSDQVALVGFSTYQGSTVASHAWDGPIEAVQIPAARRGSIEDFCHLTQIPEFYLIMDDELKHGALNKAIDQRAIGVVYDPKHESRANYVPTVLPMRYDAFYFIDETTALNPVAQMFEEKLFPETYPMGQ